jgi:ankyrin repeat protein
VRFTALHYAAESGSVDVVAELLKAGARRGLREVGGRTAFEIAVGCGWERVAAEIARWGGKERNRRLTEGLDPSAANHTAGGPASPGNGTSADNDASAVFDDDIDAGAELPLPTRKFVVSSREKLGKRYTLEIASEARDVSAMPASGGSAYSGGSMLLSHSPDVMMSLSGAASASVSGAGGSSRPELHAIAAKGQVQRLVALLKMGTNIRLRDRSGFTALHVAAREERVHVLEVLRHGADVHAATDNGLASIHFAASKDRADAIEVLISAGADIGSVDDLMYTPLHHAAESGSSAAATALVRAGASKNVFSREGKTPFNLAVSRRHETLATSLVVSSNDAHDVAGSAADPGAVVISDFPLHAAVRADDPHTLARLLPRTDDPDARDPAGVTPLGLAAMLGRDAIAVLLLDSGADVDAMVTGAAAHGGVGDGGAAGSGAAAAAPLRAVRRTVTAGGEPMGVTPLALAAANGHVSTCSLLLGRGATVCGLREAASEGQAAAVQLLIQWGADVDSADAAGETPLHKAAHCGGSAGLSDGRFFWFFIYLFLFVFFMYCSSPRNAFQPTNATLSNPWM